MRIVHKFISPKVEQSDPTLVGPNEWNSEHSILDNVFRFNQDYNFIPQYPNNPLVIGSNSVTVSPVPLGVNGSDIGHTLLVVDPGGAFEVVPITGGTAIGGALTGTIIITCTRSHPMGWMLKSSTAGIQEAYQYISDVGSNGPIFINDMQNDVYAQILINKPHIVIRGFAWGSLIRAVDNANIAGGVIKTTSNAIGFGAFSVTIDGNAQNKGTFNTANSTGGTAVDCCLMIGGSNSRVQDCYIRYAVRTGIFIGDTVVVASDVVISNCLISSNGGRYGHGTAGAQNTGYYGIGIYIGGAAIPDNIKIINNTIIDNHNFDTMPGDGCAINGTATHVMIIGNYFQNNWNVGGGQVYCANTDSVTLKSLPCYWDIIGNEISCTGAFGSDYTAGIELACRQFTVVGNIIHDIPAMAVLIDGDGSGSGTIIGNDINNVQYGIAIHASNVAPKMIDHVTISGNVINNASSYGVVLYPDHDYITVRGNDLGGLNQSIAGLTGTHNEYTDNVYSTPPAPVNVTLTPSPMTYIASAWKERISITGATTLTVQYGTYILGTSPQTFNYVLNSNQQIQITYTGSPTINITYLN